MRNRPKTVKKRHIRNISEFDQQCLNLYGFTEKTYFHLE